jgi:hypothetical protein
MTLDEVIEVVGPSEDPSTSDCLAALTKPDVLPGCVLADFWIEAVPGRKSRPEHTRSGQGRLPVDPGASLAAFFYAFRSVTGAASRSARCVAEPAVSQLTPILTDNHA